MCNAEGVAAATSATVDVNNIEVDGIYFCSELSKHCKEYIRGQHQQNKPKSLTSSAMESAIVELPENTVTRGYARPQYQVTATAPESEHIGRRSTLAQMQRLTTPVVNADPEIQYVTVPVPMVQYPTAYITQPLSSAGYYVINPHDVRGYSFPFTAYSLMESASGVNASIEGSDHDQDSAVSYNSATARARTPAAPPGYLYQVMYADSNSPILIPRNHYPESVAVAPSLSAIDNNRQQSGRETNSYPRRSHRGSPMNRESRRGRKF